GVFEHDVGDGGHLVARLDELDAAEVLAAVLEAALAAAAGVDLGLEDDRAAAELVERPLRLGGRGRDDAPRDGGAGPGEYLFRLVFVDLHRASPGGGYTAFVIPTGRRPESLAPFTPSRPSAPRRPAPARRRAGSAGSDCRADGRAAPG